MKFKVGDSWTGVVVSGDLSYTGTILQTAPNTNNYYIRWAYESKTEDDRTYWYDEGWLIKWLDDHPKMKKNVPVVVLDEELFTI